MLELMKARHGGGSGMTETTMPEIGGRGGDVGFIGRMDGVEGARSIASKNHGPGKKILHRETIWVKFN